MKEQFMKEILNQLVGQEVIIGLKGPVPIETKVHVQGCLGPVLVATSNEGSTVEVYDISHIGYFKTENVVLMPQEQEVQKEQYKNVVQTILKQDNKQENKDGQNENSNNNSSKKRKALY